MKRRTLLALFLLAIGGFAVAAYHWRAFGWFDGKLAGAASSNIPGDSGASPRKVLYWVDAMNPSSRSDKPGKASDGMNLVPVYADEAASESPVPDAVKISPQKLQLIGVQYGEVRKGPLSKTIRTVGRVMYDETKIARIHTKIEGWIDEVSVDFIGKLVEKNQQLFTIYSPELVSTEQELLIAKKAKDYLGNSPTPEVASSSLSLYEIAKDRLRLWDVSDEQIKELEERGKPMKTLAFYSPIAGFVLTRNAFAKQRVTPDTELYTVADLSAVWVVADIYEYELPMVQLGQTATMTLSYSPGKTYVGKIAYIYPQLDNTTRTLKVRLEFQNPDFALKPDMFANVELQISYGIQVFVPEEALLDSGSEQIVFVAHDGGYFEPRKVQLGAKVDGRQIILSGLKPGEKIVTSGNFLIDSESRLKSAMQGMAGMPGMEPGSATEGGNKQAQPAKKKTSSPEDHSKHGVKP